MLPDKKRKLKLGTTQKKIVLLLLGGLALGLSRSPRTYFKVLNAMAKGWKEINRRALHKAIKSLYQSHLIEEKDNRDGTVTLLLSKQGKKEALRFNLEDMKIKKPRRWDKKWRIIIFDVPEKLRRLRDSLRIHFKQLGFLELQKSVFVHPYSCEKEIEFIVEFYNARKFVRFILADQIDNEFHLKRKFGLK